ncbi:MAG: serine/threonine-protein kinase [Polyangiaceae bacterium]
MPDPVPKKTKATVPVRAEEQKYAARVGTTLRQKWRLDALIGLGGMAAVYAGTHRNGQRAAIKILHEEYARDAKVAERFLMEGYVANRVGHTGCVSVLDDDTSEHGEPFLVMELLEGETLRDYWKRVGRRVPPIDVLRVAAQILDCLEACHAQGVIHRDLKPANIFLTKTGQVKILDFGVAQLRYASTGDTPSTPTAVGTPAYMSPEQAMGLSDQLDGRTDLFSVGAIIHALCTGRRINHAKNEQEALMMAATTPVPSVARIAPDLPLEIIRIVDKALAWDRRNRFSNAADMRASVLDAIEKVSAGGTRIVPSVPPKSAERSQGPAPPSELDPRPVDPRSHPARDLLKLVEAVLTAQRAGGWEATATERALRAAHDAIVDVLAKDPEALHLAVRPSGLMAGRLPVWEPPPPHDAIPYNLYACGVRSLAIQAGVTTEELRDLLSVILLDPARDLASDDDLVTVLWEKSLPHVSYEAADVFTGGDATEREAFYEEADELAEMAMATGRAFAQSLEKTEDPHAAHPLALDEVVRTMVETQLELPRDRWRERYVEALVEGYVDGARNRDAHILLNGVRRSAATLIGRGRLDLVVRLHGQICEQIMSRVSGNDIQRLTTALTTALFGGDALELVLDHLRRFPAQTRAFAPVLAAMPGTELPAVLGALRAGAPDILRTELLGFVALVLGGREQAVADAAVTSDPDTAARLVGVLAKAGTPAAKAVLDVIAQGEDPALQMEVKVQSAATPEAAHAELGKMLESASPVIRLAALRAMVRHGIKAAYPSISRQIRGTSFHDLSADERVELLKTSIMLSPEHGEPLVVELVKKGGVFRSQGRESSRTLAAQVLGELSNSEATIETLRELAQARWGISEETRAASSTAASQIHARRGRSVAPPSSGGRS